MTKYMRLILSQSSRRLTLNRSADLSHHRAYRSVHGGSIIKSAETCTLRICHNIRGVQVFHLLWYVVKYHYLQQPSSLYECFRFGMPSSRAFPISWDWLPSFSATSTASRYTFVSVGVATRSTSPCLSSYPQFRNNRANLAWIPSRCRTRYPDFCLDCGKSVFEVCLWLSSSTLHELGCNYHLCSFPLQSRETEISDRIYADCSALFGIYLEFQFLLKILCTCSKQSFCRTDASR